MKILFSSPSAAGAAATEVGTEVAAFFADRASIFAVTWTMKA